MKDITSKVSKEDRENARIDRNMETNPPSVDPGMDDIDWDTPDDAFGGFGSSDSFGTSDGWGSSGFGSSGGGFGSSGGFGSGGGFGSDSFGSFDFSGFGSGGFGVTENKQEDIEDKFWDWMKKLGKGFYSFFGEFIKSFKNFKVDVRMKTFKSMLITGAIVAVIGVLLLFFKVKIGLNLLVGGMVSAGVAVPSFMFAYDDFLKSGGVKEEPQPSEGAFSNDTFEGFGGIGDSADSDEFDFFSNADDDDDDDFFSFGDYEEEDTIEHTENTKSAVEDFDFSAFDDFQDADSKEEDKPLDADTIVDNVTVDKGMVTRQYLYEKIILALENTNKDFDKVRDIKEGSDEFDAWDAIIRNSAGVLKPGKQEVDMPYLISAKDKLFYVLLEIKRVNWLKNVENLVNEIVSICRFDENTGSVDESVYGIGNTVGNKIYIKIMKGETAMVSIKDAYSRIAKEVKDSKNVMPIVLGVDAEGNVVWRDFKNINAILITGFPRSGKTWLVLSMLSQMMFFLKPSELQFYILDPKEKVSDFKYMLMPHIRKFVYTDKEIIEELRYIVKVEGARRQKIIGDAGFVNIDDFKKKNPDVELPLLYVVIDEIITLAERMSKEEKDEFQSLLLELVSRLPALGIRIFMIPHVVKDQILKKSITDLIPCRVSVRGDAEHIEKSVGVKNFKHRLVHQGDIVVRLNNDPATFVHSAVLTSTNEGNQEFFEFLRKFWSKIEPESVEGSLYALSQKGGIFKSNNYGSDIISNSVTTTPKNISITSKPNVVVNDTKTQKLSKEDMDDLLGRLHTEEEGDGFDIWGSESNISEEVAYNIKETHLTEVDDFEDTEEEDNSMNIFGDLDESTLLDDWE